MDKLWIQLTAECGEEGQCGWLKDKYGLSWQLIPKTLMELMQDPNPRKAVTQAMLKMKKIDSAGLRQAYKQA